MIAKTRRKHPNPDIYMTECLETIARFSVNRQLIVSQKPEGRPVCLTYSKGSFVEAIALEAGGLEGADVTAVLRDVENIPVTISYDGDLGIYGIVVMPWKQYNTLCGGDEYITAFPDELARDIVDRTVHIYGAQMEFIVWHCGSIPGLHTKQDKYRQLMEWGFRPVNHRLLLSKATVRQLKGLQNVLNPFTCDYPVGSLVFEDNEQNRGLRGVSLGWNYDISAAYRLCADDRRIGK